mmetsp:Transcript_8554/g.20757  ORF Transcript_8554/g.20757 Transcript_8554/m.20757 type:complete len:949 (-) Transcript_8554:254-3100(-)|eukprot:CAMPEP_0178992856 /NCGR_PEP_ID=MMETSP0795-20121207/6359_1 /TAXON_ID=88552 /ORGANISM="Amoebophrya sp., Strain Ameob2" /LENGTH=948 /DNA_ID=CAMNT_0020684809 /DNA_START=252 /DNA_END=3098 /DNA_ORIENTATION=+
MGGKKASDKAQPPPAAKSEAEPRTSKPKTRDGDGHQKGPAIKGKAAVAVMPTGGSGGANAKNSKSASAAGTTAAKSKKQQQEDNRRRNADEKAQRDAEMERWMNPGSAGDYTSSSEEEADAAPTSSTTSPALPDPGTLAVAAATENTDTKHSVFSPSARRCAGNEPKGDHHEAAPRQAAGPGVLTGAHEPVPAGGGALQQEASRQRRANLQNEEIDVQKQYADAKAELAKLQSKQERGAKGLSNKEKRLLEKLTQKVEDLEAEAKRAEELAKGYHEGASDCDAPVDSRLLAEKYATKLQPFAFSIVDEGGGTKNQQCTDLIVDKFSISVKGQRLFDDASLKIVSGRRYGFLGPNGKGKTTLMLHLAAGKFQMPNTWNCVLVEQEVEASNRSCVEEVLFADQEMVQWKREEAAIFEKLDHISCAEKNLSTEEAESLSLDALVNRAQELSALLTEKESAEGEVRKILAGLGFSEEGMEAPTKNFSGGWRMRIALAKGLFMQPKLLLLDEPTNHLDLEAACWLEEYLAAYPHTLITVSHDAEFLDLVCTDIMALVPDTGKILYAKGGYNAYKQKKEQERIAAVKEYKKSGGKKELKPRPDYVVNFVFPSADEGKNGKKLVLDTASANASWIGANEVSFGYDVKPDAAAGTTGALHAGANVVVSNVSSGVNAADQKLRDHMSEKKKSSQNKVQLFDKLSVRVDESSRIALVGPNGCGKSTLIRLLMKMRLEPDEGYVEHSKGISVGYYSQHFEELLPLKKPSAHNKSELVSACEFLSQQFDLPEQRARAMLGSFGLPSQQHKIPLAELSGGQKARVCFAKISLQKPRLLIFDEPTNHLDLESVEALMEALEAYSGGVVLVSHDARLVQSVTNAESNTSCAPGTVYKVESNALVEISYRKYVREVLSGIQLRAEAMKKKIQEKQRAAAEKRAAVLAEKKRKASEVRRREERTS